jgi:hypothetical protein
MSERKVLTSLFAVRQAPTSWVRRASAAGVLGGRMEESRNQNE